MDKDQANLLRDKILEDIKPLMLNDTVEGPDKFALLMRVIQTGKATSEMFTRAYESAKLIEDQEERLDALLALLDEIDYSAESVGKENSVEPKVEQTEEIIQNDNQQQ